MTLLNRPVRRETAASVRDGGRILPIVIEIYPGYIDPGLASVSGGPQ
jgi:hypothetical protein